MTFRLAMIHNLSFVPPREARQKTLATSQRLCGDIEGGSPWLVRVFDQE